MSAFFQRRKVVIVGAGAVGSTFAYALAQSGLADEIALIDKNEALAAGQALDLKHGQAFFPTVDIYQGKAQDYADAHVIVITAGVAQQPGETRLQLLKKNASIIRTILADLQSQNSNAVILIASNPVDIMTYVAHKYIQKDRGMIMGSGTVLDSARFRHLLSHHCNVDVHNVHGYILGEHGDSEFAAWGMTHMAGIPIDAYCPLCLGCSDWKEERKRIEQDVRDSAYHIIDYKGSTSFAIGLALVRITGAVLRNQNTVLTVSTLLEGEFGIHEACLGVPAIVSGRGVVRIVETKLRDEEMHALKYSANALRNAIKELETAI